MHFLESVKHSIRDWWVSCILFIFCVLIVLYLPQACICGTFYFLVYLIIHSVLCLVRAMDAHVTANCAVAGSICTWHTFIFWSFYHYVFLPKIYIVHCFLVVMSNDSSFDELALFSETCLSQFNNVRNFYIASKKDWQMGIWKLLNGRVYVLKWHVLYRYVLMLVVNGMFVLW